MAMAKVLNQQRFLPPRLPGLSLWLDAQATTTISVSATVGGVESWSDRSGMRNTMNTSIFYVPGCTLWLDASDPNATGVPAANGTMITTWKDKSGLGNNATAGAAGAATWTQQTSGGLPTNAVWRSIASSSDGTKLAAVAREGGIWTNSNSGVGTWTLQTGGGLPTNVFWISIASSSDGTKLAAVVNGRGIWTNANSGVGAWTQQTSGGLPTNAIWTSIASSSDGTKLAAVVNGGGIWTNSNSGVGTWTLQTGGGLPTNAFWISIASSSDGTKLAAVVNGGGIWTNANSGVGAWTQQTSGGLPTNGLWTSIASSSDGTKLAAVANGGGIWTNSNSGAGTWTLQTGGGLLPTNASWRSIASSSDGTKLAAVVNGGGIWTNANSGVGAWTQQTSGGLPTNGLWTSIASSSDGTKLAAVANGGGIYVYGPPALPTAIISTGLNNRPTMNFNGTSWFTGPNVNTGTTLTCFAVATTTASLPKSGSDQRLVSFAAAGEVDWNNVSRAIGLFNQAQTSSITTWRNGLISSSPITQNTPFVAVSVYNGISGYIWRNGTVGSPASSDSTGTFAISIYGIGNQAVPTNEYWNGYISEVIVFNTALTVRQRQNVEIYLSAKWGIALSYANTTGVPIFSPFYSPVPIVSKTLTNQPSIFFPPGTQMISTLNSDLGAPTIPGCSLWLDAADTATYTYQAGSTTTINSWTDKSTNGYVFTQAPVTTGAITTSIQNGKTAVNMGANVMTIPNFTWYTQFTTFFVLKSDNWFYNGGGVTPPNTNFYRGYVLSGNWNLIFTPNAGATYDPSYGIPNVTPVSSVIPNQWCVFSIGYDGGTQAANYAVNGTLRSTNAGLTPTGQSATSTPLYLNGRWDYAAGTTQLGEIIHFNRSVTSQERLTIEGYLATKWGLQDKLPPSHPYFSIPYTASFTLTPSGPVSKSIFMAYQCPQTSSTMRFAVGNDISGQAFGLAQSNGVVYSPYQYGYGDTKWSVTPNTYIVPTIASAIFDAGATMIRGDHAFNSFLDVRETALLNIISNTPYVLGASLSSSSIFVSASFHVCEIIAYNRALGTTDRQMIEGYLAWKWGMTTQLPNGHPYQKFPPTGEQVVVATTPSNLYSGLVSWLDMADSTTYTLSGNTANLKTLNDKVGGVAFTISGNVSISTLGSLPSLNFEGNNSAILQRGGFLSRTLTVPPRGCAFAVFTPASVQLAAEKLGLVGWGSPGNNSNNPALGYTSQSSTILRSYNPIDQTTSRFYGPSISLSVSKPAILFWAWYNGNMVYLASNGNTVLSTPQTAGLFNAASTNNIFYIGNDGGFGANFNLGELCVYNDYLETPFRNVLEGYLAWKWGVQANLPSFHPYALSAPTLQTLTEVNALSQPTDISGLTMWLDAGDTATLTGNLWLDKSAISNNLVGTLLTSSNVGPPARPSVYFGPGTSATSIYNSGADSKQFSAFLVASIPTLSHLLISTGQLTTGTTGTIGQTFAFYASNGVSSVFSPLVVSGTGATNNTVGDYSVISGKTFELFASICGTAVSGNMNFATPLSNVNNTANNITATPWVFGNCIGNTLSKSFHVHEFITYNRSITTLERQVVEGYLYWKWMV